MGIGSKLQLLLDQKNMKPGTLASAVGISRNTLYSIIKRDNGNVNLSVLESIAEELGVTIDYFFDKKDEGTRSWASPLVDAYADAQRPTREAACNVLQIPYVEVEEEPRPETVPTAIFPSAAGIPVWVGNGDMEDREYPPGVVPKGTSFAIRITGDSMQPTIPDGAYVFVKQQPEVRNNEIGVFMLFDDAVCKRFYKDKNGVKLLSDNPKYDPIPIAKDTEGFGLVGKVLGHYVFD